MLLALWALLAVTYSQITERVTIETDAPFLELPDNRFLGSGWEMWSFLDSLSELSDPVFRKLISHIGPGVLRVGGITCDWVNYTVPKNHEETLITVQQKKRGVQGFWPDYEKPITMANFKLLVDFAAAADLSFVFGLNELHGRNCHVNGEHCVGNWDTSNVRAFLTYIRDNKVGPIHGFELGNELTVNDYHIPMSVNIADYKTLNSIFTDIWPDKQTRPPIYGPSVDHCNPDVDAFMEGTKSFLTGFTYHTYPGRDGSQLASQEVSIDWLKTNLVQNDLHANSSFCIDAWTRIGKPVGMEFWITETNAAYNGIENVMNAFENSFWYLASLGQFAKTGVQKHCRWALYGGDTFAFVYKSGSTWNVVADYWVAVLYKQLVGRVVLNTSGSFDSSLVYAHCGPSSGSVTLIVINPSTSPVTLSLDGVASIAPREEYIFTATALDSRVVQLNGENLVIGQDGSLPGTLKGKTVTGGALVLPKYSYGFVVLSKAGAKACE